MRSMMHAQAQRRDEAVSVLAWEGLAQSGR
jgi:hypothetical protein